MIPTEVSGSRLPVGSSQTRSGGWLTNARAIETRCCSPPESSLGERVHPVREADHREHLGHLLADRAAALALHLERVGDVLGRRAVGQQLEVLEYAADVAAQHRHLGALEPRQVAAADDDLAARRLELLQQQAHERRLARAGRADDEHELALVDVERDVAERDDIGLVDLRHALEHDHRAAAARPARRVLRRIRYCSRSLAGYEVSIVQFDTSWRLTHRGARFRSLARGPVKHNGRGYPTLIRQPSRGGRSG